MNKSFASKSLPSTKQIIDYTRFDIWRFKTTEKKPKLKSFFLQITRIILLACSGFKKNKCKETAASLTFYTLLSIVPVIAMSFAIAKGFSLDQYFEQVLQENMKGQQEIVKNLINFGRNAINNTKGADIAGIAGIGVCLLFFSVLRLFTSIERAFNDIWGVIQDRTFIRKITDYLAITLACLFGAIFTTSLAVFMQSAMDSVLKWAELPSIVDSTIRFALPIFNILVSWVMFTFIYLFIPNTKVKIGSAIIAGIIAGSLFQTMQWGIISIQIGVTRFSPVYGSFAAIPFFLMWLQMAWLILLLGAEISYSIQNLQSYAYEPDCRYLSHKFRKLLSLYIVKQIAIAFKTHQPPLTDLELSQKLDIPIRLLRDILKKLILAKIISPVACADQKTIAYQPAMNTNELTPWMIFETLDSTGSNELPSLNQETISELKIKISQLEQGLIDHPNNEPITGLE